MKGKTARLQDSKTEQWTELEIKDEVGKNKLCGEKLTER